MTSTRSTAASGDRVGYCCPPKETQFKKGQPPPPRKKKKKQDVGSITDLFWRVLLERRRVTIGGKVAWLTNVELIARRAFSEGEKGCPTLLRILNEMLLEGAPKSTGDGQPEIIWDPTDPEDGIVAGTMTIRDYVGKI